jgi:hypothetical protein
MVTASLKPATITRSALLLLPFDAGSLQLQTRRTSSVWDLYRSIAAGDGEMTYALDVLSYRPDMRMIGTLHAVALRVDYLGDGVYSIETRA